MLLNGINILIFIDQNPLHMAAKLCGDFRLINKGHYRIVKHIGITDAPLLTAPVFKQIKQVDKNFAAVGQFQRGKHLSRRLQARLHQINKGQCRFDPFFPLRQNFLAGIVIRQLLQ